MEPRPASSTQSAPAEATGTDARPWYERAWEEAARVGQETVEGWVDGAKTVWDALPGTADDATTAAARERIVDGVSGTLEGIGTMMGPPAEMVQSAYMSGDPEAIAMVEQMQHNQREAFGAIGDAVKGAWDEAYARNGAAGASAMVLATLGMEAVGGKGAAGVAKAAEKVADIVRLAKTPLEAANKLEEAIAAAKAAGASADEIAVLERARAQRLAQARREAAKGNDGVVIQGKKAVRTADDVNAEHVAKGNDPPYMPGTNVVEREAKVGERFSMVIDEKQKGMIENGETRIGGWATLDAPTSQAVARDKLAILPEYKPDLPYVIKIEVIKPGAVIREGIVGPQGQLSGGARQVELVMPPPQRSEFFKVVEITSLPEK